MTYDVQPMAVRAIVDTGCRALRHHPRPLLSIAARGDAPAAIFQM